ncbi:hypothetical protein KBX37_27005 [Micromonospora sp. U56]|uniref:COG1470 family protein n=1 Tax=Micromonospora sp. U56 TaxID=2824900 RepID=UPI001B39C949|nr:hypothetical protein [Micromonospora sp. U56]MBQ0896697.1 hypothetical protein [Micromonospora sp. U56]
MSASANLALTEVTVTPGGEAQVTISVRNTVDIVEAYRFEMVGVPAEWVTIEPPVLSLYPGTAETVTVTFRPPRSSQVPAGGMPFGVRVLPSEHPEAAVVEEGTLVVLPFADVAAELRPQVRDGRWRARYRLETENRGNLTEQLAFDATDTAEQLTLAVRPARATLAAGERLEPVLVVRAKSLLWRGEPRHLPFRTQVLREDGVASTVVGTFVQRPILSAWLLKLLALLLALLLVLLALWFGLLRPVVRSAAREAVDGTVEQAAVQAADRAADQAVDKQRRQTPEAPKPPAGGGTEDGGGRNGGGRNGDGETQFSTAISFRTNPGGSAERSYTVPARKIFLLTDFLVDNPQGDEGTLSVSANGVKIVTYGLENFREQDYHSVTPIRVPARAQVTLTVACRRPGTPVNARTPSTCSESLYVNGIMADATG